MIWSMTSSICSCSCNPAIRGGVPIASESTHPLGPCRTCLRVEGNLLHACLGSFRRYQPCTVSASITHAPCPPGRKRCSSLDRVPDMSFAPRRPRASSRNLAEPCLASASARVQRCPFWSPGGPPASPRQRSAICVMRQELSFDDVAEGQREGSPATPPTPLGRAQQAVAAE